MSSAAMWDRYCRHFLSVPSVGFSIDISRVRFADNFLAKYRPMLDTAIAGVAELERGAIANRDENRMVGHYWLRAPERAPTAEISREITTALADVQSFAAAVHAGKVGGRGGRFSHVLLVGIGGSALGPQFVADALAGCDDALEVLFLDNTDPDGIDRVLSRLHDVLDRTLVVVVSKSGSTPETRNGMIEVQAAFRRGNLPFPPQAVAITQEGSRLDQTAISEGWLKRFPMWDWVGGRTSVMSTVGLVPAALQGIDIAQLLAGAAAMDTATREPDPTRNPAALLAMAWHHCTDGRGAKDMVILPYKDRLLLLSRYLQQLIMESLGKQLDRNGLRVEQGIAVYGNKGSTDQHAYVQQLRDGVSNFFATFLQVLKDRDTAGIEVDPGIESGDYLTGFLYGTRSALYDNQRDSITLTIDAVTPHRIGGLIALFERAVSLYAEMVNINAYHQPGVEAGKKAAAKVLELQRAVCAELARHRTPRTAAEVAAALNRVDDTEDVFHILHHLSANPSRNVSTTGTLPQDMRFTLR